MLRKFTLFCLLIGVFGYHCTLAINPSAKDQKSMHKIIKQSLDIAAQQSRIMAETLTSKTGLLPKSVTPDGKLETARSSWWTSGFFPGQLWYVYQYTNDPVLKKYAEEYTQRVRNQMHTTDNHDVGFMIFCSFGNACKATGDKSYKAVIDTASQSLSTRFNSTIGAIRSWNFSYPGKKWQYPVIIDNMMNLEMLMWASKTFHNEQFKKIAIAHADKTMKYHFRPDFSCYHVVSYDPKTGLPEAQQTAQGYSDASSWARGQAWALYGYTMMYRETRLKRYLTQANNIAHYLLTHPRLPKDKIPYWDFDAPNIPNALRDASAGAIICSALIELSQYANKNTAAIYLKSAETQLRTLSSPEYRATPGQNNGFILRHSVGNMPNKTEVDAPLTYADYYYVEALLRYKQTVLHEKISD